MSLPVFSAGARPGAEPPPEPDDPYRAFGRRIVRIDVESSFATVYLTFDDGYYLSFAARIDDEGCILLDRFCEPAATYSEYWAFDELEGESGPDPASDAIRCGSGYAVVDWKAAEGRVVRDIGWYEEGMQAFVHFEAGGYLTLAARVVGGVAYLIGYCATEEPPSDDEYVVFDVPDEA